MSTAPATRDRIIQPEREEGRVPTVMRAFAERAIGPNAGPVTSVTIRQLGDMWRRPEGRPMHFTALETFGVYQPWFRWDATFPLAPFVHMRVRDSYSAGRGAMRGWIVGVPVMNRRSADISVGAAMRYLAELPWAPHAILANSEVEWRTTASGEVEASLWTEGGVAAVRYRFDDDGDVVGVACDVRPRDGDVPRPWRGRFGDYGWFGDVRVPRWGEVTWELPAGPFTYWRGVVIGAELTRD